MAFESPSSAAAQPPAAAAPAPTVAALPVSHRPDAPLNRFRCQPLLPDPASTPLALSPSGVVAHARSPAPVLDSSVHSFAASQSSDSLGIRQQQSGGEAGFISERVPFTSTDLEDQASSSTQPRLEQQLSQLQAARDNLSASNAAYVARCESVQEALRASSVTSVEASGGVGPGSAMGDSTASGLVASESREDATQAEAQSE